MATPDDVKARVASAYNHAADFYDHACNAFWDRAGRRTIERLGIAPGWHVLDLCCGTGASALPAAIAAGPAGHVVAIDLADELIRLGREKAARLELRNIDFRQDDLLALDLVPNSFDAVVCVFGIFFVPDMTAALRQMWSFVRPGGRLAVTTWGSGLFEPINSMFWDAIRRVRPGLFKSFNPWDRLGEAQLVRALFDNGGLPAPEIVFEPATHPIESDRDVIALLMGTGYRGVIAQLSTSDRARVQQEVLDAVRSASTTEVRADVIRATCFCA